MLTVAKVTQAAAGGYGEYLHGRVDRGELGDYYLRDGMRAEAPGRWVAGAPAVGCDPDRRVSGEQLAALMAVRRPDTGQALRRVGANGEAVAALDATFSAPKSVSAVWASSQLYERLQIEAAHEHAIDQALAYAVDRVAMIRDRVDADTVVHARAASVLATGWRHTTARAVQDDAPDPQLHSHVLLHGGVRQDGKVMAIDSRSWLVHRRELGAAYRTVLAHELYQLGYQIQAGTGRGGRYFEIDGVPAGLLDRWSSRRHQVKRAIDQRLEEQKTQLEHQAAGDGPQAREAARRLELLDRYGQLAPGQERYMATATRAAKNDLLTRTDLDHAWQDTAREHGLDPGALAKPGDVHRPVLGPAADKEILARLTEFDATFPERDARAVALEASAGSTIGEALGQLQALKDRGEVVALADGRLTTRQHRHAEQHTLHTAQQVATGRVAPLAAGVVAEHADTLDLDLRQHGAGLSSQQRDALELACSDRQLTVIEGQAGTGKSTVLAGVARAHQAEGREVIVTSTAALAAARLAADLQAAGVQADAYSTAALHAAITSGRIVLGPESTVIHDEAALASTREQHQLLAAVQASGARVILVGDPKQSQAVGAGGLWPGLEQAARENQAHVELTTNLRASDPADRRAQKLFRDGETERALSDYDHRGRVSFQPDQRQAEDAALEAAHADRQAGNRSLVIAQTSNEHLDELNARAQAIRHQNAELGPKFVALPGRPYELHPADEVQIRRNLHHPDHGQLRNGTTAQITTIDAEQDALTLRLDDGRRVALDRAQIDRADLRLSYVQHPFPAQGQTTDTAHLIVAEHATQEGSYVAITRARQITNIYATQQSLTTEERPEPIAQLATRMSRTEPEVPSISTPLAHEDTITRQHSHEDRPAGRDQPDHRLHEPHPPSPPEHTVAVLGSQPGPQHPNRQTWDHAAAVIERYRTRYDIPAEETTALGPKPPAGHFRQRHDQNQAASQIIDTRQQLNPREHKARPSERQIRDIPGLIRNEPEHQPDRTPGWEP